MKVIKSEPHRLEVHDHPEDGWSVIHPESCSREAVEWDGVVRYYRHDCNVEIYRENVGLSDDIIHVHDDPWPEGFGDPQVVLPGMYTLRHTLELSQDYWSGYWEAEDYITVEPQRAITTGWEVVGWTTDGIR